MAARLRLIFMGTPEFSVPALKALAAAGHEIVAVYTRAPKPAGRGQRLSPTPVHTAAEALGLRVLTPASLKGPDEQAEFAAFKADAAVVVAYGLILPVPILEGTRLGCFNLHASLLPRWRGAAPINRAIMAGDTQSGVMVMRMAAGLDTGPVLATHVEPITPSTTAGGLHDRLSAAGAPLMVEALNALAAGTAQEVVQPEEGVTYAKKLTPGDGSIDWTRSAHEIDCQIRGLSPVPGAWTMLAGERIKVLSAVPVPEASGKPGLCLDDALTIACGQGALRLTQVQRPGRAVQDASAMLRGFPVPEGTMAG